MLTKAAFIWSKNALKTVILWTIISESESDVTWPSMVTHTRNSCSAFNHKHTGSRGRRAVVA